MFLLNPFSQRSWCDLSTLIPFENTWNKILLMFSLYALSFPVPSPTQIGLLFLRFFSFFLKCIHASFIIDCVSLMPFKVFCKLIALKGKHITSLEQKLYPRMAVGGGEPDHLCSLDLYLWWDGEDAVRFDRCSRALSWPLTRRLPNQLSQSHLYLYQVSGQCFTWPLHWSITSKSSFCV